MIDAYLQVMLQEREWSWTLAGIVYLVFALMVRGWFLRSVVLTAKELERKIYQEVKTAYLERSIWGWLFFFLSFLMVIGLWATSASRELSPQHILMMLVAFTSYTLSLFAHLSAWAEAAFAVLKRMTESSP